jgi:hypothetical protein
MLLFVSLCCRKRWAQLLIREPRMEAIARLHIIPDCQRPQQHLYCCLRLHRVLTRWWL